MNQRFVDDKIVLFDKIDMAFTYLNQKTELFRVDNVLMQDTMKGYVESVMKVVREQTEYFTEPLGKDVF